MSSYQEKYIKYKNKYNDLKNINALYDLVGGKTGFNPADIKDIFKHIEENLGMDGNQDNRIKITDPVQYATYPIKEQEKIEHKTKYFVICYGPPASGKSLSRKIACNVIKQHFNDFLPREEYKDASIDDLMKTFVDTSVDDIVYNINTDEIDESNKKKTVKDILVNNINSVFKNETNKEDLIKDVKNFEDIETQLHKELTTEKKLEMLKNTDLQQKFQSQIDLNQKIYFNYKEIADDISLLLGAFAILRKKNVFFEIASPAIEYINDLISVLYKWKYNIIFIYPYTTNIDLLCVRSVNRGCVEGRLVPRKEIEWKTSGSIVRYYDSVINTGNPNSMLNKLENFYVLRYNANMILTDDKNNSINNGTFNLIRDKNNNTSQDNLDIYDLIYKDKKTGVNTIKITDINGIVTLKK